MCLFRHDIKKQLYRSSMFELCNLSHWYISFFKRDNCHHDSAKIFCTFSKYSLRPCTDMNTVPSASIKCQIYCVIIVRIEHLFNWYMNIFFILKSHVLVSQGRGTLKAGVFFTLTACTNVEKRPFLLCHGPVLVLTKCTQECTTHRFSR